MALLSPLGGGMGLLEPRGVQGMVLTCTELPVVHGGWGSASPVPCEDCSLCNLTGVVWILHMPFDLSHLSLSLRKMGAEFLMSTIAQG